MTISSHDEYVAAAPEQFQPVLTALRAAIAGALPDAEEVIKYDMPGFQIGSTIVASYAAFSKQCGLYVATAAIAAHAADIAALGLKATKTGITFSASKQPPDALVGRLVRASREDSGL